MPGARDASASDVDCPVEGDCEVSVCRSRPGKVVFIESGNTDGWIATDTPVHLEP